MASHNYWGEYAEFGDEAFNNTLASLLQTTALFDETEDRLAVRASLPHL